MIPRPSPHDQTLVPLLALEPRQRNDSPPDYVAVGPPPDDAKKGSTAGLVTDVAVIPGIPVAPPSSGCSFGVVVCLGFCCLAVFFVPLCM